jgi:hypothetical protein
VDPNGSRICVGGKNSRDLNKTDSQHADGTVVGEGVVDPDSVESVDEREFGVVLIVTGDVSVDCRC